MALPIRGASAEFDSSGRRTLGDRSRNVSNSALVNCPEAMAGRIAPVVVGHDGHLN
ncbi:MAG: hypothetical protein ABIR28_02570 [Vicinamibacteria bacterium]